jgi:hypothetical protein
MGWLGRLNERDGEGERGARHTRIRRGRDRSGRTEAASVGHGPGTASVGTHAGGTCTRAEGLEERLERLGGWDGEAEGADEDARIGKSRDRPGRTKAASAGYGPGTVSVGTHVGGACTRAEGLGERLERLGGWDGEAEGVDDNGSAERGHARPRGHRIRQAQWAARRETHGKQACAQRERSRPQGERVSD